MIDRALAFRQYLLFIFYSLCIHAKDISISEIKERLHCTQKDLDERGKNELKGFVDSGVWQGGYYEGDPLSLQGDSSYHMLMNYKGQKLNPLYICFVECLRPYINHTIDVLEIGPGRGAWTQSILALNPKKIICLDALSAKHNKFWKRIRRHRNVSYIQIKDFQLRELSEESIDFVFSFGTFCHISSLMCYEYFKNLFSKLRPGAQCFIMYADFDKKNQFAAAYELPYERVDKGDEVHYFQYQKETNDFRPTWYHLGRQRLEDMLNELGYEIINGDIGINDRDPIAHFRKPMPH